MLCLFFFHGIFSLVRICIFLYIGICFVTASPERIFHVVLNIMHSKCCLTLCQILFFRPCVGPYARYVFMFLFHAVIFWFVLYTYYTYSVVIMFQKIKRYKRFLFIMILDSVNNRVGGCSVYSYNKIIQKSYTGFI